MDAGGIGVPAAEVATRFDHLASVTPGERKTPAEMSREEYEALPVVYHGGRRAGSHLYVSSNEAVATTFGSVRAYRVLPGSKIYPDPEAVAFEERDVSGSESLRGGSAVVGRGDLVQDFKYESWRWS